MRDVIGRLIALCIFAPIYLGAVFIGVNYAANILAQIVPIVMHWFETRQVLGFNTVRLFDTSFLFSIPPSYKWMHYIFGAYFGANVVIQFYRTIKLGMSTPVKPNPPSQPLFVETEGERLERLKRETEENLEALRLQQAQQAQQTQPQAPQIQVVPIPVQLNTNQLEQFNEIKGKMQQISKGEDAHESQKTRSNSSGMETDEDLQGKELKSSDEPLKEEKEVVKREKKIIQPAKSVKHQTETPKARPKAFKRNRNLGNGEEVPTELGFKKPVGVPDKIYED